MSPDYATVVHAVRERLSAGSADHCERVAEMAAHLAAVYGVDVEGARVAGVLHDWSRDLDDAALVEAATAHGIDVSDADRAVPYLLHAPVGAAEVKDAFPGIAGDIVTAIADHTYGSTAMGELGTIVYIADAIEPARMHAGAQELRDAVGEVELAELFARTYAMSLQHIIHARRAIHPRTVGTWNAVVVGIA